MEAAAAEVTDRFHASASVIAEATGLSQDFLETQLLVVVAGGVPLADSVLEQGSAEL